MIDLDKVPDAAPEFEVLPENLEACELFLSLCDQWRVSQAGIMGIDGNTVLGYLALCDFSNERKRELYQQVQLISSGAITAWREAAESSRE